jgi:hypothetical protein
MVDASRQYSGYQCKVFQDEPDIQFSDYALACEWNKLEKYVKQVKFNGEIIYCAPAVDEKKKNRLRQLHAVFTT